MNLIVVLYPSLVPSTFSISIIALTILVLGGGWRVGRRWSEFVITVRVRRGQNRRGVAPGMEIYEL